mgnify:FL=1
MATQTIDIAIPWSVFVRNGIRIKFILQVNHHCSSASNCDANENCIFTAGNRMCCQEKIRWTHWEDCKNVATGTIWYAKGDLEICALTNGYFGLDVFSWQCQVH